MMISYFIRSIGWPNCKSYKNHTMYCNCKCQFF